MRKVVLAGFAACALWLAWALQRPIFYALEIDWSPDRLGPWGDTFGALSALFSAGAFIGAVYALLQQQKQIEDARSEQEQVNREARNEQHRQRFESSYFELLRLLRETRNDVSFKHSNEFLSTYKTSPMSMGGVQAFRAAWREVEHWLKTSEVPPSKEQAANIYEAYIHKRYESNFGPYFRLVYTILKRIKDDRVLDIDEKARYGNLLRSQLNSFELAVVGLNGLSSVSKDFSDLVIYFHLLKYLPPSTRRQYLEEYYPIEAFTARD